MVFLGQELRSEARRAGLQDLDVMLKQGFSWGGNQVTRLRSSKVPEYLRKTVVPSIPKATELTVLLQAKVELVAELRWVVLDGELRGCGWVTLPMPRRHRKASSGCYKTLGH